MLSQLSRGLLIVALVMSSASAVQAQTYFWGGGSANIPGTGTGASLGGAGNWNTTASNWDTGTGLPYGPWVNASNLTANFGGPAAGTVALDESLTVGGLQFFTTAYVLNTGANTLNFGAADNLIAFRTVAAATITGSVSGTGNVTLTALRPTTAGTLTSNGTSTGGWSGSTTVNTAMTLTLTQSSQALLNTSGINFTGGNITLTNTTAAEAALDRVANAAGITANGGVLTLANTSGANVYAETIGTVALTSGQMTFLFSLNAAGTGSQTLTLGGLTRTGTSNTSAVNFAANSGLNTTKNIMIQTGATATTAGQIIGPWATTGNTAGANDYAVYNATSQIVPAGITLVAGGEATWTVPTDAYTNNVAAQTLTTTRTVLALRNTAATATLTLAAGANLETFGLLNGATTLLTVAPGTGGVLTTPTGGGFLYLNSGNGTTGGQITVSAPIGDNGGAVSVVKNGAGVLVLTGINTFTGNLIVNAGTLTAATAASIGGTAPIIFDGSATFNSGSVTYARGITINNGATLTFGNANPIFSGNLSGNGTVVAANGFGTQVFFTGTGNTFEGPIVLGLGGGTTGQAYRFSTASFADSATANGRIVLAGNGVTHADGSVFEYTGATALILNNRIIELASAATNPTNGHQIRSSGAGTFTINTGIVVSTTPAQTITLGGSNTTANAVTSNITNGTSSAISLTKANAGLWVLSGTNTYTGFTSMGFSNPAGTGMYFQGLQALPPTTTLRQTHPGGVGGFGTFRLLDDTASPISRSGVNISLIASNTTNIMTLFVGNNGVANGGNGAGGTTDSTIILGNISYTQTVLGNTSQTLAVTGANSYRLQINNVNLPSLVTSATTWSGTFTPTTAPLTIAGTVQQVAGSLAGTLTLTLDGTNSGNLISGSILDSLDATPRSLTVTKSNTGTWALAGNNAYSGNTNVNAGVLNIRDANALGAITAGTTVANAATLQLQGGITFAAEPLSLTSGASGNPWLTNLSGTNTWTGTVVTTGTGATVRIQSDADLLTIAGTITGASASTQVVLQGNGAITVTGQITGASPLTSGQTGTGVRTISNSTNNYTGNTSINGGTLRLGAANVIPDGVGFGNLAFATSPAVATLDLASFSETVNGLSSTSALAVIDNSVITSTATLTVGNNDASGSYIGTIVNTVGTVALTKIGTGTLTLSGANTYGGGTIVLAGALAANTPAPNSATGSSAVTVTGGTLRGTGRIAGAITLNGGTIAPGDATNAGVLTAASLPILMTGGLAFNLTGGLVNSSQLTITGAGTLDLGALLTLTVTAFTGITDPDHFTLIATTGGTVNGTFAGFPEGATVFTNSGTGTNYVINYGTFAGEPGNVVLAPSVVPEPALIGVMAFFACGLRVRRRTHGA